MWSRSWIFCATYVCIYLLAKYATEPLLSRGEGTDNRISIKGVLEFPWTKKTACTIRCPTNDYPCFVGGLSDVDQCPGNPASNMIQLELTCVSEIDKLQNSSSTASTCCCGTQFNLWIVVSRSLRERATTTSTILVLSALTSLFEHRHLRWLLYSMSRHVELLHPYLCAPCHCPPPPPLPFHLPMWSHHKVGKWQTRTCFYSSIAFWCGGRAICGTLLSYFRLHNLVLPMFVLTTSSKGCSLLQQAWIFPCWLPSLKLPQKYNTRQHLK